MKSKNKVMKNPKVDTKNRVVCAYHDKLNMYSFHKINKKNLVAKKPHLPTVISESFELAVDKANVTSPLKIQKTKFKSVVTSIKECRTWNEFIELAWKRSTI